MENSVQQFDDVEALLASSSPLVAGRQDDVHSIFQPHLPHAEEDQLWRDVDRYLIS